MRPSQHFCFGRMNSRLCGVREMRSGLVIGLALALAAIAGPGARAFQEQPAGTPPAAEAQSPAAPAQAPTEAKPLGLSDEAAPKAETGTEIRIPGLGKLGVLPKMDFGLELLYGAADQKQPEGAPESTPATPEEDIMIRGSVKHRF
jgi:hypothetical protein